jgi:hypothetical protein
MGKGIRVALACGVAAVLAFVGLSLYGTPPTTSGAAVLVLGAHVVGTKSVPFTFQASASFSGGRPPLTFIFKPGPALSTRPRSGLAYRLETPPSGSATVQHVAGVFGLSGTPGGHGGAATRWSVGTSPGALAVYQISGSVPTFTYTGNSCEMGTVAQGNGIDCPRHLVQPHGGELSQAPDILTHSLIIRNASKYVRELGFGYGIGIMPGTLTFSPKEVNPAYSYCLHTCTYENAWFSLQIGGVLSDQGIAFTFNQRGAVVAATGPAFMVSAPKSYPLMSPADAVLALDATHPTQGFGIGPPPFRGERKLPPLPPAHGTLNRATVILSVYVLHNGSLIYLPVYTFSKATYRVKAGGGLPARDVPLQGFWSILAITPSDVHYVISATG